jgi:hypothetical protein
MSERRRRWRASAPPSAPRCPFLAVPSKSE